MSPKKKKQELKSQDQHPKGGQGKSRLAITNISKNLQGNQGRSDVHLDEVSNFYTYPIIIIYPYPPEICALEHINERCKMPSPFLSKNENDNLHRSHNSFLIEHNVSFKRKKEDKQKKESKLEG